jgi:hypothetical protein
MRRELGMGHVYYKGVLYILLYVLHLNGVHVSLGITRMGIFEV